jgi:hypothetical protein
VELEVIYFIIFICSSLGFMIGSVVSPSARLKGKEIAYWRGLTGDFKKQLKAEKRSSDGGLDDLLAGGELNIGSIFKVLKNNPDILKQVSPILDLLKSGKLNTPDLNPNDGRRELR